MSRLADYFFIIGVEEKADLGKKKVLNIIN